MLIGKRLVDHRPEMLGRLEFKGIGWQELQADAFGDLQVLSNLSNHCAEELAAASGKNLNPDCHPQRVEAVQPTFEEFLLSGLIRQGAVMLLPEHAELRCRCHDAARVPGCLRLRTVHAVSRVAPRRFLHEEQGVLISQIHGGVDNAIPSSGLMWLHLAANQYSSK